MALIKEDDCPEGLPGWLATFGDLMSLLLTFFVLLLSFSSVNVTSFNHAMGALQGALGVLSGQPQLSLPVREGHPKTEGNLSQAELMNKAAQEMEEAIEEAGLQGEVHLDESTEGIIIRLEEQLLFDSAEATLKDVARPALDAIGRALSQLPNEINVQGHSDNRTINTPLFASNWELSGMRALSVARYFIGSFGIPASQFSITGFSEYQQLAPNDTEENMRLNRRVEIHVRYLSGMGTTPTQVYKKVEDEGIGIKGRERSEAEPEQ